MSGPNQLLDVPEFLRPQQPESGQAVDRCVEVRLTAKQALRDRIRYHLAQAAHLQALHDSIPEVLPPAADAGLHALLKV